MPSINLKGVLALGFLALCVMLVGVAACSRSSAPTGMQCSIINGVHVSSKDIRFHFHCAPLQTAGDWEIVTPIDLQKVKR